MANGKIEKNDLITDEAIAQVEKLKSTVTELVAELSKLTKEQADVINSSKKLTTTNQELATEEKKLQDIETQSQKIRADLIASTDKVREKEAELIALKEQKKKQDLENSDRAKAESVLNSKIAGTLEKLTAENKLLLAEKRKLNLETKEGQDRLTAIKAKYDQNTAKIKANASATEKQRMNIGNYKSALEGLSPTFANVSSTAGNFISSLAKLGPYGLAIGAVFAAIAAPVYAFFAKTQDGAELLERKLAGLKAGASV